MTSYTLDGIWSLYGYPSGQPVPDSPRLIKATDRFIEARVPGNVELDLLAAGEIDDPARGNNIYKMQELEFHSWWFTREFDLSAMVPDCRAEIVFEGIDCFAEIWVNDNLIGLSDNMLIAHRFDVSDFLRPGVNRLAVHIRPTVLETRKQNNPPGNYGADGFFNETLYARKAPHMFGWNILPRLVSAGLWRGVRIDWVPAIRIANVYWGTLEANASKKTAAVLVNWQAILPQASVSGWKMVLSLVKDGQTIHEIVRPVWEANSRFVWYLDGVDLWWPRGMGNPSLYTGCLKLINGQGEIMAQNETNIGIRTVKLSRTETTGGTEVGEFVFYVNGEKTFMRGTNWIPLDAFHSRDPQHLERTFDLLVQLNCNMVRCWGGNVYEDQPFFDLCDRHGVLVWQDFAMACGIYPQTDDFAAKLDLEAEAVITKLRNHPSLALWSGNNEGDEAYEWAKTGLNPNEDRPTREVLPKAIKRLDPLRPYLPSSPYHSPEMHQTGDFSKRPEVHIWASYYQPEALDYKSAPYSANPAHFVSEIGYHGCPSRLSLEQYFDEGHLWPAKNNDQWFTRSVRPVECWEGNNRHIDLMFQQAGVLFRDVPEEGDAFVLASQITQAEAFKFFIEYWRMGKWHRTGILWWNLRDGWSVITSAIVDYYYRKKLAYHYIQQVQQDICLMVSEPADGKHVLYAVNDTLQPVQGVFTIRTNQAVLLSGTFDIPANGICSYGRLPESKESEMWFIEWNSECIKAGRNHYLAGPRPVDLDTYRGWLAELHIPQDIQDNLLLDLDKPCQKTTAASRESAALV